MMTADDWGLEAAAAAWTRMRAEESTAKVFEQPTVVEEENHGLAMALTSALSLTPSRRLAASSIASNAAATTFGFGRAAFFSFRDNSC